MADKDTDLTAKQMDEENNTTATGNTTATDNNANTASNVTETTTRQKITVPEQFHGTTHKELYDFLQAKMAENQPLSKEEMQKLRKRQRAEGIVAGISDAVRSMANLFTTTQYAPDMYNPQDSMSAKAKARFDKEKAERDAADDRFYNYAINYARLQGEDKAREYDIWKTERNMQMQQQAYDDARKDREEDVAYRQGRDKVTDEWKQKEFDESQRRYEDAEKWKQKEFNEGVRQFDKSFSLRYSNSAGRGSGGNGTGNGSTAEQTGGMPHMLGDGTFGYVSAANWENDKYIDQLYAHIQYWAKTQGSAGGKSLFSRTPPTTNAKRSAINHYFNQRYGYRDRLGSEIMLFDANYGEKKSK